MWIPRRFLASLLIAIPVALACTSDDLTQPTTGTLEISTATSGAEPDPDGYTIEVDAGQPRTIGASATLQSAGLTPGNHTVQLAGVAANCHVEGDNPRQVAVLPGETTTVTFNIVCLLLGGTKIAFISYREGNYDVFTMNLDGSGQTNLTSDNAEWDRNPVWSPDGSKLAFIRGLFHELFVMNADGTGLTNLYPSNGVSHAPAWSPDGRRIAFSNSSGSEVRVVVMDSDGRNARSLTAGDYPRWSPDGTRIAFARVDRGFDYYPARRRIFVMNADGTNQVAISTPGSVEADHDPQWSPDGSKIAFVRSDQEDDNGFYLNHLWVVNSDGSNPTKLTNYILRGPTGSVAGYSWSPDGTKLAFGGNVPGGRNILVIHPDGTGQTNLTNRNRTDWYEHNPVWSYDGRRILFSADPENPETGEPGNSDIFVMDFDGSNITNLTNNPFVDHRGAWQP